MLSCIIRAREGVKTEGSSRILLGKLLGATIRTRFEDESRCRCLRVYRSAREGICFAVSLCANIGETPD